MFQVGGYVTTELAPNEHLDNVVTPHDIASDNYQFWLVHGKNSKQLNLTIQEGNNKPDNTE